MDHPPSTVKFPQPGPVRPGWQPRIDAGFRTTRGGTSLALVRVMPVQCHGLVVTVVVLAGPAGGPSVLAQDAGDVARAATPED